MADVCEGKKGWNGKVKEGDELFTHGTVRMERGEGRESVRRLG